MDPGYIISLIRKLLPPSASNCTNVRVADARDSFIQGSKEQCTEEGAPNDVLNSRDDDYEAMDTVIVSAERGDAQDVREDGSLDHDKHEGTLAVEEAWEEYGCVLWDLAASKTHSELMVC